MTMATGVSTRITPVPEQSGDPAARMESGRKGLVGSWVDRLGRRKWAVVATLAVVVTGMAYMLEWGPVVLHSPIWMNGADLWGIFRGAHFVGWGYLGGVYTPSNSVLAFPGMEVLLAPVAMLSSSLHLTESYVPYLVPRPTAALVLQPFELLLASTVIFATDALAERLGVTRSRRICLCFIVAVVAWSVAAIWGHAEDALATTFALYAMIALIDRKWSRCGWLLGFGIVMQPLVALLLPLFIGATPAGRRLTLAARSTCLSVVLVGVAFIGNPTETFNALVKQPTPLAFNHPTPWAALAPRIATGPVGNPVSIVHHNGRLELHTLPGSFHAATVVSGGAGRIIDVMMAVLVGVYVWRRPQEPLRLLWLFALVLASRCFFEPVMTPYYLAPPLFLILVMAARMDRRRFWAAVVIAGETTLYAYYRLGPWQWWLPIVAGLAVMLALGFPKRVTGKPDGGAVPDGLVPDTLPLDIGTDEPKHALEPAH
jgi:hypothetical protein